MSKGVFLAGRRCCRTARVRVWCRDASETTVADDLAAVLAAQKLTARVRRGHDPAAPLLVAHFRLPDADDAKLTAIAAALTARGYEAF